MFFLQFSERENKLQQSLHEVNKLYQYLLILEKNIKFYKIVTNEVVGMKREHLEFEVKKKKFKQFILILVF